MLRKQLSLAVLASAFILFLGASDAEARHNRGYHRHNSCRQNGNYGHRNVSNWNYGRGNRGHNNYHNYRHGNYGNNYSRGYFGNSNYGYGYGYGY